MLFSNTQNAEPWNKTKEEQWTNPSAQNHVTLRKGNATFRPSSSPWTKSKFSSLWRDLNWRRQSLALLHIIISNPAICLRRCILLEHVLASGFQHRGSMQILHRASEWMDVREEPLQTHRLSEQTLSCCCRHSFWSQDRAQVHQFLHMWRTADVHWAPFGHCLYIAYHRMI